MGQYFFPVMEQERVTAYRLRDSAKLKEHSWWDNPSVNSICAKLYRKRGKLVWLGDYAESFPLYDDFMRMEKEEFKRTPFSLDGLYLCNHTSKKYVDCDAYKTMSEDYDGNCLHPLPLLTCAGNGKGGGDYSSNLGIQYIGSWCWQVISIEDAPPEGYEKEPVIFDSLHSI